MKRGMRAPLVAVGDGALGLLGGGPRCLPQDAPAAGLGSQDRQRARQSAEGSAAGRKARYLRDHQSGEQGRARRERLSRSPMSSAPDGPSRSPSSSTTRTLCSRSTTIRRNAGSTCARPTRPTRSSQPLPDARPDQPHQRSVLARRVARDGVQAHRGRGGEVEKINGHELVVIVRAGAKFVHGKLVEAQDDA
jgi:hypothetical protein